MAHKPGYIFVVVLAVLVFVGTLFMNALAGGAFGKNAVFHNTTGEISNAYYIEITPAGWTFSIWGLIYIWQALWLIYGLSTLCRSTSYMIPAAVYVLFVLNNIGNVSWLLLWDRQYPQYGLILLVWTAMTLYAIMYFSSKMDARVPKMQDARGSCDVWLTRILLQNGIALYAAWSTIACFLNMAIVLTYQGNLDQSVASTIALGLLLVSILTWFFLETTVWDRYLHYVLSPFIALILGLVGSIAKNWEPKKNNSILTAVALATVAALALVKIILMFVRLCKKATSRSEPAGYVQGYSGLESTTEKIPVM